MDGDRWYRIEPVAAGLQPALSANFQAEDLAPRDGSQSEATQAEDQRLRQLSQSDSAQAEDLRLRVDTNATQKEVERFFRLDKDAGEAENRIIELGPELKPAIDCLQGIRLMRPSSLVETVFTFMCTANNNLHRIIPMCWKLGSFGTPLEPGLHTFPTVERIASIDDQELRMAGFGYRGSTIPRAARAIQKRGAEDWFNQLRTADYRTIHTELCGIPGIGPKLADCICLYGFDRGEAVPLDTHIWQAFIRLYHPEWQDKSVTDFRYREATARFRDRFGELSGWAQLFLFYENLLHGRDRKAI